MTDQVLTHCVAEMRQAIGDSDQAIIKTIPRRGYRFAAPVVRVAAGAATPGITGVATALFRRAGETPGAVAPPAPPDAAPISDRPSLDLAEAAVHLDPLLPQARAQLGAVLVYKGQHDAAIAEFERAVALNPYVTDHGYAEALMSAGEPARAIELHVSRRQAPRHSCISKQSQGRLDS